MNFPIMRALSKYINEDYLHFHTPGHKMGRFIPDEIKKNLLKFDLTELHGLDNLHFPNGAIKEAQELYSKSVGSLHTFFLVNGSSVGILASILTVIKPQQKIVVCRDCHRSIINALTLSGATPIYIKPEFINEFGITASIAYEEIEQAISKNPDIKAVILTRPTVYGVCCDIERIARLTKEKGIILIVDEAHGAHLPYYNTNNVPSAIKLGATLVIQSAHKTLPAPTQTALLHVCSENVDIDALRQNLSMLQTTSPSYIFMLMLDFAREFMQKEGRELLDKLIENVDELRHSFDRSKTIKILQNKHLLGVKIDPSRLTINFSGLGKTGYEIEKILRVKYNILAEMSDMQNVVFITTVADTKDQIFQLTKALKSIEDEYSASAEIHKDIRNDLFRMPDLQIPINSMTLKDVYYQKTEVINIKFCKDRVSKYMLTPYPPGIPVICPGEVFTDEIVSFLINIYNIGAKIDGMDDNMMVKVVAND